MTFSSRNDLRRPSRRDFLKAVGGGTLAAGATAHALHHPRPSPQSLPYLDQRIYLHNMEIIAHFRPGERRSGGMQMMSIGAQRLLFQSGDVIDVTDPRNPQMFNEGGVERGGLMVQLAYSDQVNKWILMQFHQVPYYAGQTPFGKYDDPAAVEEFRNHKGLRGLKLWDVTDPAKVVQLSEFSRCMTGSGPHSDGSYWDGGRYAFLDCAPDDTFTGMLGSLVPLSNSLMIVDVSDPANVKEISRWWLPGQRLGVPGEMEAFKQWPQVVGHGESALPSGPLTMEQSIEAFRKLDYPALDRMPYSMAHGAAWVPTRIEDGGTRGYGSWAALGFMVFDFSNPAEPRLMGRFDPTPTFGMDGIPFHTVWLPTHDRGFVVAISEAYNPDCNETWLPSWVIDVRDGANPVPIAMLPRPRAPKDAPYTDFCFARGRFGAHAPAALKAPGRASQTFLPVACFNAGLRCYDLSEPTQPRDVAYFVAPHGGDISDSDSFNRPVDNAFVEWDRKIMYAATTTGLYVLTSPALGEPILDPTPITEWSMPSVNKGAPV